VPAGTSPPDDAAPAILAYDGSAPSEHAVSEAAQLLRARPASVATVWLTARYVAGAALVAVPDEVVRKGAAALDEAARVRAVGDASEAAAVMTSAGWSCSATAVETSHNVPSAIVETAGEHGAALIVTGTRGRSRVVAGLLGSSAESILRTAGRPVLLVPPVAE
jgi:nucleotide-binding universal stress UspA family protein